MKQQRIFLLATVLASLCLSILAGCASPPCCSAPAVPITLRAVGHGATNSTGQYTLEQQKLLAMRAAKVDAYRHLAEQVYGYHVVGQTSVAAFTTQSNSVKTYVDTFIRGARIVDLTAMAEGNYEAVVELEVPADFVNFFAPR